MHAKPLLSTTIIMLAGLARLPTLAADEGVAAHWKLAGDVRDHSGHGLHGENHGADLAAAGIDGKRGGAAGFDGRAAFVEIPGAAALKLGSADFSIALWVHTAEELDDVLGDLLSKYDPQRRVGFNFSITHRQGVTHSQANFRNVHFGIDNGRGKPAWVDRGRPGNAVYVHALAIHAGQLYAGTCEPGKQQAGHVYRYDGGQRWVDCGSPDRCNAVSTLAVHGGKLYAGTAKYRLGGSALAESENANLGGRIFRFDGEKRWIDCGRLPDVEAVGGMVVFRGKLYASSLYKPAGFFRYEGGQKWIACATPGGKRVEALGVFNGYLFATSYDEAHVYRFDGTSWTDCGQLGGAENTQTYALAAHQGQLYASTWRSGRVFRYQGDKNWADVGRLGEELEVMGMAVHNGKLYAGTLPSAEVYRYDGGSTWTSTGQLDRTPNVRYRRAWTMAEYQGQLFCGTLPSGHVFSLEVGKNVTYDHELPPGWHHLAAVRDGGRLKLFLDAKLVATSSAFTASDYDISNTAPLRIGFGPTDYFHGRLRDVRIYKRGLTAAEVAELAKR